MAENCPICLDNHYKRYPAVTLACGHTMHLRCLGKYINRNLAVTCPLCRGKIVLSAPLEKSTLSNINAILKHRKCRALTKSKRHCRSRAYPGNFGYCRQHRVSNYTESDITSLSTLLTREFHLNFHSKVALYDLYLSVRDRYGDTYLDNCERFHAEYTAYYAEAVHYRDIYVSFKVPYPGDNYFLNMANLLFDCGDLE